MKSEALIKESIVALRKIAGNPAFPKIARERAQIGVNTLEWVID